MKMLLALYCPHEPAAVKCMQLHAISPKFAWKVKSITSKSEEIDHIFFMLLLFDIADVADIVDIADVTDVADVAKVVDIINDDCLVQ